MSEEKVLVEVGSFCMNEECGEYQRVDTGHVHRWGYTEQGKQRYWCEVCGQTFGENKGTPFYRRRVSTEAILESLSLIAKGSTVNAVATTKGYRYETDGQLVAGRGGRARGRSERGAADSLPGKRL